MSVTIPADYKSGDWVPATNPCPSCGEAGGVSVREVLTAKRVGTFSLAGRQMKFSAVAGWGFRCTGCGASGPASPKAPGE